MHTMLKSVLAIAAATVSLAVTAQPYDSRDYRGEYRSSVDTTEIDARIARQQERIDRGVQRGQLSPREARMLWREHRAIEQADARAKADGRVSHWEAQRLVAMLDRADWRIRQMRRGEDLG